MPDRQPDQDPGRVTLHLRFLRRPDPWNQRLKGALKVLLRRFGLKLEMMEFPDNVPATGRRSET